MTALEIELREELAGAQALVTGVGIAAGLDLDDVLQPRVAAVDAERELADAPVALEDTSVDLALDRLVTARP